MKIWGKIYHNIFLNTYKREEMQSSILDVRRLSILLIFGDLKNYVAVRKRLCKKLRYKNR